MRVPISRVAHHLEQWARKVPESAPATCGARMVSANSLRILGFHGVEDLDQFGTLMDALAKRYQPVSADQVRDAVRHGASLPKRAMWVTFDDGLQSTFDAGALLHDLGISATAFVCPNSIGTSRRLWFQTVEVAERLGLRDPHLRDAPSLRELKTMPDADRRAYVDQLESGLQDRAQWPENPSVQHLHTWTGLGHTVGNHTWDHPCLDTCSPAEQERQVVAAHERLQEWGVPTTLFAYPNGNYSRHTELVLQQLGYDVGVLFDHRLARASQPNLQLSRLRIDSSANVKRGLSIASGSHSATFQLANRVKRTFGSTHGYP